MKRFITAFVTLFFLNFLSSHPVTANPTPTPPLEDSGLLWLINSENPLPASYAPPLTTYKKIQLHPAALEAYKQLLTAMEAENIPRPDLHSAYRPYARQQILFKNKRDPRSVQPPGASEHQSGLALDITTTGKLTQDFGTTKTGQWLAANAHNFGFILRYPESKTHTTGIIYEPWHFRYVGIPHAAIMQSRDLVLEEYADFLATQTPYTYTDENNNQWQVHLTDALPKPLPNNTVNISATHYGTDAKYILLLDGVYTHSIY